MWITMVTSGEQFLKKYDHYQDNSIRIQSFVEIWNWIADLLLDRKSIISDDEKTRCLLDNVDSGILNWMRSQ